MPGEALAALHSENEERWRRPARILAIAPQHGPHTLGAIGLAVACEVGPSCLLCSLPTSTRIDPEGRASNDRALARGGGPLASMFESPCGITFYIVTESPSATTVLLPEEF